MGWPILNAKKVIYRNNLFRYGMTQTMNNVVWFWLAYSFDEIYTNQNVLNEPILYQL